MRQGSASHMKTNTLHCKTNWERQVCDVSICPGMSRQSWNACRGLRQPIKLFFNHFSGKIGGCVLASWLHPELQWAERGQSTNDSAETTDSRCRVRLHRDKCRLSFCWQVQSLACRSVLDFVKLIKFLCTGVLFASKCIHFLYFYRAQTSPGYDECTTVKKNSVLTNCQKCHLCTTQVAYLQCSQ